MKLTKTALLATTLLAATVMGNTVVAHADDATTDTKTSKTTTAKFNVTAGDFEISAVPTFNFGTKTISELMGNPTLATTDAANIAVTDYRGAGSNWQLNASLGDFTNGDSTVTGTIKLNAGTAVLADATSTPTFTGSSIDATSASVWNSKDAGTDGTNAATATIPGATLTLGNKHHLKAGEYSANITWTLKDDQSSTVSQG